MHCMPRARRSLARSLAAVVVVAARDGRTEGHVVRQGAGRHSWDRQRFRGTTSPSGGVTPTTHRRGGRRAGKAHRPAVDGSKTEQEMRPTKYTRGKHAWEGTREDDERMEGLPEHSIIKKPTYCRQRTKVHVHLGNIAS